MLLKSNLIRLGDVGASVCQLRWGCDLNPLSFWTRPRKRKPRRGEGEHYVSPPTFDRSFRGAFHTKASNRYRCGRLWNASVDSTSCDCGGRNQARQSGSRILQADEGRARRQRVSHFQVPNDVRGCGALGREANGQRRPSRYARRAVPQAQQDRRTPAAHQCSCRRNVAGGAASRVRRNT